MELASDALARMDYLTCEVKCLQALVLARREQDWDSYSRILLPLQESRRQRRMIAAEAIIRLGSTDLPADPESWLIALPEGCIVVTHPHTLEDAKLLRDTAWRRRLYVEVLYADNPASDPIWKLTTFDGPSATCYKPAPPAAWIDRWLSHSASAPGSSPAPGSSESADSAGPRLQLSTSPADWFLDAAEALGDATLELAQAHPYASPAEKVDALRRCLDSVTDHEIIHQELASAARTARLRLASADPQA